MHLPLIKKRQKTKQLQLNVTLLVIQKIQGKKTGMETLHPGVQLSDMAV